HSRRGDPNSAVLARKPTRLARADGELREISSQGGFLPQRLAGALQPLFGQRLVVEVTLQPLGCVARPERAAEQQVGSLEIPRFGSSDELGEHFAGGLVWPLAGGGRRLATGGEHEGQGSPDAGGPPVTLPTR